MTVYKPSLASQLTLNEPASQVTVYEPTLASQMTVCKPTLASQATLYITIYPLTEEIRLKHIWMSRSTRVLGRSFEWRGLRLLTCKLVWNFGISLENSLENVFGMYGGLPCKLVGNFGSRNSFKSDLFCGKWPIKTRHRMTLHHPVTLLLHGHLWCLTASYVYRVAKTHRIP